MSELLKEKDETSIFCVGFLFTEKHKTKKFPKQKSLLTLENVIDNAGTLHFVFFSKFQAYQCKTGMHLHGTILFCDFYDALQKFSQRRQHLYIYFPNKSYNNDFLMVINNSQHSSQFPWMDIIIFFNKIPIEQRKSYGRHSEGNAKDLDTIIGIIQGEMVIRWELLDQGWFQVAMSQSLSYVQLLCRSLEGAHQISVIGILLWWK